MTRPAATSYILCSNPRSGTTLLCRMLAKTGRAGAPDSFLREQSHAEWAQVFGLDPINPAQNADDARKFLLAVNKAGKADTDVFGMRIMAESMPFARALLGRCHGTDLADRRLFDLAFNTPRYIYLIRKDKLAQAVSYVRAQQSGLWHRHADGQVLEQLPARMAPGYDAALIARTLWEFEMREAQWADWFAAQNIHPLRIFYEDMAQNPKATLAAVLDHVGQDRNLAQAIEPDVAKLADAQTAEWIARYRDAAAR